MWSQNNEYILAPKYFFSIMDSTDSAVNLSLDDLTGFTQPLGGSMTSGGGLHADNSFEASMDGSASFLSTDTFDLVSCDWLITVTWPQYLPLIGPGGRQQQRLWLHGRRGAGGVRVAGQREQRARHGARPRQRGQHQHRRHLALQPAAARQRGQRHAQPPGRGRVPLPAVRQEVRQQAQPDESHEATHR